MELFVKGALIFMFILAMVLNVFMIGKERKPMTSGNVAVALMIQLLFLVGIIVYL